MSCFKNKFGAFYNAFHPSLLQYYLHYNPLKSDKRRGAIRQMLQKRDNFGLVLQIFVSKCCKHFTLIASRPWQVVQAVAMAESIAICQYLLRTDFPPSHPSLLPPVIRDLQSIGRHIHRLCHRLHTPTVSTLHTILQLPPLAIFPP